MIRDSRRRLVCDPRLLSPLAAVFSSLAAARQTDHVGLVVGWEMSRLARSCKDWNQTIARQLVERVTVAVRAKRSTWNCGVLLK